MDRVDEVGRIAPSSSPELSVVVPVYGCAACLDALHSRLVTALSALTARYEIVFVDDRSPDGSWARLRELAELHPSTVAVRLSRNFGQHAAITAGLERARGEWVVVMDCDLQDPPEEIERLYDTAREGHDIVYARRRRVGMPWLRRVASALYVRLMNVFAGTSFEETGSFSILSRRVVDEFLRFKDRHRQYLLILHWLGFDSTTIEYERGERLQGPSSYSTRALVALALDGLFFQTTALLRWIVFIGFAVSGLGLAFAVTIIVLRITGSTPPPGFSSLAVFVLTIGGFTIFSTGVTGLYIGRVFEQVRERPLYVIDSVVDQGAAIAGRPVADAPRQAATRFDPSDQLP